MVCEHTEKDRFKNINQLESKPQDNLCGACSSIRLVSFWVKVNKNKNRRLMGGRR